MKCDLCGQEFVLFKDLTLHYKRKHREEQNIPK